MQNKNRTILFQIFLTEPVHISDQSRWNFKNGEVMSFKTREASPNGRD